MKKRAKKLQLNRETLNSLNLETVTAAAAASGFFCNTYINTCVEVTCGVCACGPSCAEPCHTDGCPQP